ncbi:hypothetical protein [Amphritea pacifica]|uniref:hypothetical protein n=1 Tax=Amphritea pacifica TaxID=2811233 RepID=UPI001963CEFA|nr:hypothetical protein [Amphritea pacifica]MBN1008293.1 hypothetical protein [Amphritea pacifica]
MESYKLIKSVLGGIYGAQVGLDDEEAIAALQKDLQHEPFREGIETELKKAFSDKSISWVQLMDDCEVSFFETEEEAKSVAKELLWDVVFPAE